MNDERLHSEWIEMEDGNYFCKNCMGDAGLSEYTHKRTETTKYCPHCGAIMERNS